jgi:hypothetical protein
VELSFNDYLSLSNFERISSPTDAQPITTLSVDLVNLSISN